MHDSASCSLPLRTAAALLFTFLLCGCPERDSTLKRSGEGQKIQPDDDAAERDSGPKPPGEGQKIQPDDNAKVVLSKAMAAHGGTDKVSRWSKGYLKYTETMPTIIPAELGAQMIEDTFDLPGHFKRVIHGKRGAETMLIVDVFNFGVGWVKYGTAEAQPSENHCTDRTEHIFATLCDFSGLCSEDNERTRMPDEKMDGRDAAVINVKTTQGISANLFIDKHTGLLIGTRNQQTVPGSTKLVNAEVILKDHRTFQDGVYPTTIKVFRDEKLAGHVRILEMKFLEKVDEAEFKKP